MARLSKVELHLHLDCSLSYQVVSRLAPAISRAEFDAEFIAPRRCTSLIDFLKRAPRGFQLMQTEEALEAVTEDIFEQLAADHVVYAEIRFAPLLHCENGLSPDAIVSAEANPITGQIVAAKVRLSTGETLPEFRRRMRLFCQDMLPAFKIPQKVLIVDEVTHGERFKKMRRAS